MSGRVDPCRTKKQSFDCFRRYAERDPRRPRSSATGTTPPPPLPTIAMKKSALTAPIGGTGVWHTRDPHNKTVYVVASYPVAAVELLVNGRPCRAVRQAAEYLCVRLSRRVCDAVRLGRGRGYGYDGTPAASDQLETADSPAALQLTLHTAPGGLAADGADIALCRYCRAGQRRAGLPALRCAHRLHH